MVKRLNERDERVLGHVARYRVTDADILSRDELAFDGQEADASSVLERLAAQGWLGRIELRPESPSHSVFNLSTTGAKLLGLDAEFARPLCRESRVEWFAIARFCCGGEVHRQLFTKSEFQNKFHELWYPGQPARYYLEPDGNGSARLAFLKVDKDAAGRWERLIDSCNRFLVHRTDAKHVAVEHQAHARAFERLVKRGKFQFTVLTALAEKKRSIQLEIERRQLAGERVPPIAVCVMPELSELLFTRAVTPTPPTD